MTSMRAFISGAVLAGGLAVGASGGIKVLTADQDPVASSEFSLAFGGAPASPSQITFTQFDVQVDVLTGTAQFTDYYQEVDPLLLPLPDGSFVSTGALVIEIVPGSSFGTFDASTNTFQTTDLYAIHFTGDLSAFGFSSPVILPGDSFGLIIDNGTELELGDISLSWDGQGELPNPLDPSNPIPFAYTCETSTNFEDNPRCATACPGDVNRDCGTDTDDLLTVLQNFGEAEFYTTQRRGDVNGDQRVDLMDLFTVLSGFGSSCH